jgi:hypothetical protein
MNKNIRRATTTTKVETIYMKFVDLTTPRSDLFDLLVSLCVGDGQVEFEICRIEIWERKTNRISILRREKPDRVLDAIGVRHFERMFSICVDIYRMYLHTRLVQIGVEMRRK